MPERSAGSLRKAPCQRRCHSRFSSRSTLYADARQEQSARRAQGGTQRQIANRPRPNNVSGKARDSRAHLGWSAGRSGRFGHVLEQNLHGLCRCEDARLVFRLDRGRGYALWLDRHYQVGHPRFRRMIDCGTVLLLAFAHDFTLGNAARATPCWPSFTCALRLRSD